MIFRLAAKSETCKDHPWYRKGDSLIIEYSVRQPRNNKIIGYYRQ